MSNRGRRPSRPRPAPPRSGADPERFVSTARLAELTGLPAESLWRFRREGGLENGIHYARVGRRLLWHVENFRRWQRNMGLDEPAPPSCSTGRTRRE